MRTISLVDDSATIRQMVTSTLQDAGYKLLAAVDGSRR